MSNQQGRIRFRRRTPWEAADLGARLVAEHMWFYGALWFCAMLPWHLLLTAFFHDRPQWVLYLLWWSKPAFEAGIVAVLSVQVFGKMPTFSDSLKQAWRLIVRPRIVGEIEILITKGWDARAHFDGQSYCDLHNLDRITIRRYRNSLRMLHPADYNYFKTLRQKLHWGEQLV